MNNLREQIKRFIAKEISLLDLISLLSRILSILFVIGFVVSKLFEIKAVDNIMERSYSISVTWFLIALITITDIRLLKSLIKFFSDRKLKYYSAAPYLLLGIVIGAIFQPINSKKEHITNRPLTSTETMAIQDLLKVVQKELGVESEIASNLPETPEWKNNKHDLIRLNGYSFFLKLKANDAQALITDSNPTFDFIREQNDAVTLSFEKAGAKFNDFNQDVVGDIIKIQTGFTKDDIRCLAQFTISDPYASIFCGVEDPIVTKWLDRLSRAADPTDNPNLIINIEKVVGNNASVNINSKFGGGHYVLLNKSGFIWQQVFEGQDLPTCALVDKYKMDKRVYGNCYDETTSQERFPIESL